MLRVDIPRTSPSFLNIMKLQIAGTWQSPEVKPLKFEPIFIWHTQLNGIISDGFWTGEVFFSESEGEDLDMKEIVCWIYQPDLGDE